MCFHLSHIYPSPPGSPVSEGLLQFPFFLWAHRLPPLHPQTQQGSQSVRETQLGIGPCTMNRAHTRVHGSNPTVRHQEDASSVVVSSCDRTPVSVRRHRFLTNTGAQTLLLSDRGQTQNERECKVPVPQSSPTDSRWNLSSPRLPRHCVW